MSLALLAANYSRSDGDDFFGEIYLTRPSKIVILVLSLILTPINVVLLYSVIWFERFGSDLKRTLVNQAVSSMCWWGLVIDFLQNVTVFRCSFQLSARKTATCGYWGCWDCKQRHLALFLGKTQSRVLLPSFLNIDSSTCFDISKTSWLFYWTGLVTISAPSFILTKL